MGYTIDASFYNTHGDFHMEKTALIKNHTHVKKVWGTPQNFCLVFFDELEKQLFVKKLLKWANKGQMKIIILDHFLPFHQREDPENQTFDKLEETSRGIVILHMYTINENHMM